MLILIFQEAHWSGVEIHRGGRESPSVSQDGSNHPETCCGATRWHRAAAVERWECVCFDGGEEGIFSNQFIPRVTKSQHMRTGYH